MKKKVAVLFGGQSLEHEVSRVSASSVLNNIDREKYEVITIGITKKGEWYKYTGDTNNIKDGSWESDSKNLEANGQNVLFRKEIDVVFPVLHGENGEDGTIQGLCRLVSIPCVGCGVLSSAVCMDKVYTKYVIERKGIKQAPYVVVTRHEYGKNKEYLIERIEKELGYPCFAKAAHGGSSVGTEKAHDRKELEKALEECLRLDRKVLVEKGINVREIEVAVLGNDEPKASLAGEVVPCKEFYDYEAKYQSGDDSEILIPAPLDESASQNIRDLAVTIYKELDCAGLSRVDFFIDKDNGDIYFNEINTLPGFTQISMYPKMWDASGIEYPNLIDTLIELAIERNNG